MSCRSVSTIVCGFRCTLCLSTDRNVDSFGVSGYGVHGHKDTHILSPRSIPSLKNIKSVSCYLILSACLDYDGNVYIFGSNNYGQLGIGVDKDTLEYTHIPQKVNLPSCKEVSCGRMFTICLSDDDLIYSFGHNENGQLGLGNNESYNSPKVIESLKDVEFIECGEAHAFCKTFNNEVYCWGYNYCGQLGLGNRDSQNTPKLSSLSNEDIIDIKCGCAHTLVLTSKEDVLSCGNYENGHLGRFIGGDCSTSFEKIEELSEIIRIECGYDYSMCIDINNDLFLFGANEYGQLGLGDTGNRYTPIKHPSLSNIIDISKGGWHTFVKTSKKEIYAFGNNEHSQLGINAVVARQLTPIRVFEDKEDIWCSNSKPKAKSARFKHVYNKLG